MKRIFFKTGALAMLLLTAACDDKLNVQPTQSIDESVALLTEADVEKALVGVYNGLQSANLLAGSFQYTSDLMADNGDVRFGGTFATHLQLFRKAVNTNNTQVASMWTESYFTINIVNNVLANLDKVKDPTTRQVYEGQALLARGYLYFELVRLFAKPWGDGETTNPGVPVVLTPTRAPITDANNVRRNTVAEVYTQVIADLTKAETQLRPTDSGGTEAAALLSRVYLMQANYAGARDAANRVIASGQYVLDEDFTNIFLSDGDSDEIIFSLGITDQDGVNGLNLYYAATAYGGRGDIRVQPALVNQYEAGDVRRSFFYVQGTLRYTGKYIDQYGDVIVVRLAEMYLTRAEANLRLGTSTGATPLADVNLIRSRAGLAPLATVVVNDVLRERKLELALEGHLLHDLKRTRRSVGALAWNANALVLPIPQREIDANPVLVQNPGY